MRELESSLLEVVFVSIRVLESYLIYHQFKLVAYSRPLLLRTDLVILKKEGPARLETSLTIPIQVGG